MLDEFHRSFREQALKAEGQRKRGSEDGKDGKRKVVQREI